MHDILSVMDPVSPSHQEISNKSNNSNALNVSMKIANDHVMHKSKNKWLSKAGHNQVTPQHLGNQASQKKTCYHLAARLLCGVHYRSL